MRNFVPLLVNRRVFQAEVGGEIDHHASAIDDARGHCHCRGMGHGQEHDIALIENGIIVPGESELGSSRKARVFLSHGGSGKLIGGNSDQFELGMPQRNSDQLYTSKAGCTDNTAFDAHTMPFPFEV